MIKVHSPAGDPLLLWPKDIKAVYRESGRQYIALYDETCYSVRESVNLVHKRIKEAVNGR